MPHNLFVYNTLTRNKELFEALNPPFVGMYVCGPTVYGNAHLGHARPAITFDVLFRFLQYLGYKVRYVRNITDVGHLVGDADEGEDKIQRIAKLEKIEPMEIVDYYVDRYHHNMKQLNVLRPNIEPRASGHIIEQQEMTEQILANGFAYESNGSIYFDVEKYNKQFNYGKLSGRVLDDLQSNTRDLEGQDEKHSSFDFALWKKASPEHLMRWRSAWGDGFPGWHIECSVMSTKYLGEIFDIHGGGMDLLFPHHECEIAQSTAATGREAVRYWMHNNMITINGQKMGKSLNNFITLNDLFAGNHRLLQQAYSPMTIRFFILQAHYRSTLDFSNEALQASEKGLQRLLNANKTLQKIQSSEVATFEVKPLYDKCLEALLDDLNTPIAISYLFEAVKFINSIENGTEKISAEDLELLKKLFNDVIFNILGLIEETTDSSSDVLKNVVDLLLQMRLEAKQNKDFKTSDRLRNELNSFGIEIRDKKDGFEWDLKK